MESTFIERTRGDTLTPEQITVVDEDTGDALDVTGNTFLLTVNTDANPTDDTDQIFQLVGVLTDPTNGVVEFTLTDDNADNIGNFFFDVQMTSAGKPETVMKGRFTMCQDITK